MTELRQSSPFAGLSVIEDPEKARREAQEMSARMFSEGMSASDIVNGHRQSSPGDADLGRNDPTTGCCRSSR